MKTLDDKSRKAASLLAVLLTAASTSYAQDDEFASEDSAEAMVLDEVIVTARKREETLQESPVAISALSADALKEAGVANTRDLQQAVPGLNFSEQGSKNPSIFVRGIGARESNAALDPSVGVYINGIYIPRTDGQLLDTVDTESVQVLRGPQGTLFGKNNTGGAMLVTTKAPHNEGFEGYVTGRFGNFGRRDVKASANIPLNDDSLAMRAGVSSTKSDGFLENDATGAKFGDEDRIAATARVSWQATDTFNADVFTFWSKQNERGAGFTCVYAPVPGVLADYSLLAIPDGNGGFGTFQNACNASENADFGKVTINGPSVFQMQNAISALTLTWELEDIELKSITAYSQQWDITVEDDQDATALQALGNGTLSIHSIIDANAARGRDVSLDDEERSQLSQELQAIGSALDDRLSYTVGLFYSKEEMENNPFTQLVGNNGWATLGVPNPALPNFTVLPAFLATASDLTNEAYAVFAQATYDLNDYTQLTLGARYTVENRERTARVFQSDLAEVARLLGATAPTGDDKLVTVPYSDAVVADLHELVASGYLPIEEITSANPTKDKTFRKFTPMGTLSFKVPENLLEDTTFDSLMTYVTVSQGFKAGGFEPFGTTLRPFDQENVTNVELGLKADAFNSRVRFNTAVYRMDYEDIQVRVAQSGQSFGQIFLFIDNAGEATIQGVEMELTALITDGLTLNATANYTDYAYDEFEGVRVDKAGRQNHAVDRSREPGGSTPPFTFTLTLMYDLDTEIGLFIPRLTGFYRDEVYTGVDLPALDSESSYIDDVTLWTFRMAYIPADLQELNVSLFVKNLTDEEYFQGGFTVAETLGAAVLTQGPGREYGIEATYNF